MELADALAAELGGSVTGLTRLTAGASMESWAFVLDGRPLILRRAPGGSDAARGIGGISLATEAAIIRIARAQGVTAPDVIHVFDPKSEVGAAFAMTRLSGEALPHKLFKDATLHPVLDALPARLAQEMAAIHAIPTDTLPKDIPLAGARELIESYRKAYTALGERRPVFELAFRWLEDICPAPYEAPALIHGDFRMGNLLIDHTGLTGVLDWEITHRGDPHQDLAYICAPSWRFGRRDKVVGGIGDLQPFLEAYEATSGRKVDPARFQFWQVLTTLFWGSACMLMLADWREGRERTLERAAIGRRISEVEIDLLLLLQEIGEVIAKPLPDLEIPDTRFPVGQTSLREMMIALSEWNASEVMPTAKGRALFQSRIAANLLDQLQREAHMGRDFSVRSRHRLQTLRLTPEQLNNGLGDGSLDWRSPDIFDHLRLSTMERLLIDQPHYHGLKAAQQLWSGAH
jgi:aminoglycoside phosphotransferase (APT) family kinase protein